MNKIVHLLIKITSHPLIGRPIRKFFWIGHRLSHWISKCFLVGHNASPYVKKIEPTLNGQIHHLTQKYYTSLTNSTKNFPLQPQISIILKLDHSDQTHLEECIKSIQAQTYQNYKVAIAENSSYSIETTKYLQNIAEKDPSRFTFSKKMIETTEILNDVISHTSGTYFTIIHSKDRLYPHAFSEVVRFINDNKEPDILYSDERKISTQGNQIGKPYYKPRWSHHLLLSTDYLSGFCLIKTERFQGAGGFRHSLHNSHNWGIHELLIRLTTKNKDSVTHVPFCLTQIREPLKSHDTPPSKQDCMVIAETLSANNIPTTVSVDPLTKLFRFQFEHKETPLVSIIIPSKNSKDLLSTCIESILEKTTYKNIEIIVSDNGSSEQDCLEYYKQLQNRKNLKNFQLVKDTHPFNFGLQINRGVASARGSYVLLLNNDTEVISPTWIEEMLHLALLPGIGAVGCKLLYPDLTIQHAGVTLAREYIARHSALGFKKDSARYHSYFQTVHEVEAVTAACMLIKKQSFEAVEGFDEINLPNGFGDVDFCLKLSSEGFKNLYTPYAELIHKESKMRGLNIEDFELFHMQNKYSAKLLCDRYLNPRLEDLSTFNTNHSHDTLDCSIKIYHDLIAKRLVSDKLIKV